MCFYIGIEDLAANALIETLKKNDRRFLTYHEIESYGAEVVQILQENGEKGISLKEGKEAEDLIQQFRGYLALDVLLAFVNQRSVQVLGV